MDNNMGGVKCTLQFIPCTCVSYTDQLDHAWIPGLKYPEQPRYVSVTEWKYNGVFGHYNY